MMPVGHAGGDVKEMDGNVYPRLQGEPRLLRNSDLGVIEMTFSSMALAERESGERAEG